MRPALQPLQPSRTGKRMFITWDAMEDRLERRRRDEYGCSAGRAHILQERPQGAACGQAAADDQLDNAVRPFVVECNNILIQLLNDLIDQFVVVLNRTSPEPEHLFLGERGPRATWQNADEIGRLDRSYLHDDSPP